MGSDLRVGMIGVKADRGWAREAHVPAVAAVDGLTLTAVATRDRESAEAAASAFGVSKAYDDAHALITDPEVDVVTVAASVPAHHELILAAIDAGKHVVTEWPVGVDTAQTAEIAKRERHAGLHAAVGLQARMSPAALLARELVAAGTIGRVITATVYSSTMGFGRVVAEGEWYLEKPETGMNLQTIQTAHTLDFALRLTGPLTGLAALTTIQYPQLAVGDPARTERRTIPDHVLVHGRLADGGALAAQIAGGRPAEDTPFRMDIVGEKGVLTVEGGAPRGFQAGTLTLSLDGRPVDVDGGALSGLPTSVVNVAGVYAALHHDIVDGTRTAPDFDDAVRLSHLVDDVLLAAADGAHRAPSADWPQQ